MGAERKKERYNNLDLLRMLSMYFVVCLHYVGWGGIAGADGVGLINLGFSGGLAVACNVAVNCFYMISGFFIRDEETYVGCKRKIVKVYIPVWIYSVCLPVIAIGAGQIQLDIKSILLLGVPMVSNQYWFATCYIAITALLPFISKALCNLKDRDIGYLLGVLLFWDCIQPIMGINAFSNIGYGLLHALTMYILGYWIRRNNVRLRRVYSILIYVGSVMAIVAVILLSMQLTGDRNRTIADYNSPLMVLASFGIFTAFLSFNVKTTFWGRLAPYVFGVYLLNDNQYLRDILWQKIFHCSDYYHSNFLIVHCLLTTIVFMIVALAVEFVRQKAFDYVGSKMSVWKSEKMTSSH